MANGREAQGGFLATSLMFASALGQRGMHVCRLSAGEVGGSGHGRRLWGSPWAHRGTWLTTRWPAGTLLIICVLVVKEVRSWESEGRCWQGKESARWDSDRTRDVRPRPPDEARAASGPTPAPSAWARMQARRAELA